MRGGAALSGCGRNVKKKKKKGFLQVFGPGTLELILETTDEFEATSWVPQLSSSSSFALTGMLFCGFMQKPLIVLQCVFFFFVGFVFGVRPGLGSIEELRS